MMSDKSQRLLLWSIPVLGLLTFFVFSVSQTKGGNRQAHNLGFQQGLTEGRTEVCTQVCKPWPRQGLLTEGGRCLCGHQGETWQAAWDNPACPRGEEHAP